MPEIGSTSRRRTLEILATAGLVSGLASAGWTLRPAHARETALPALLTRPVPRSGEPLPAIGLGTYRTFDVGTAPDQRGPVREVLRRFVELGGSVVDSSPMYGRAEAVVGELAHSLGVQDRLFHATKVWTRGADSGVAQMQASFRSMRVQRMGLMQVHNLLDLETHLPTLKAWKEEGRIRYLGITHYQASAHEALERWMRSGEFDFVQVNYSLAEREAESRLLPAARDLGVGVLVNRPFAQASLFRRVRGIDLPEWCAAFDCGSWAQFFLKFIVAHPAVTAVLPATGNPRHLDDNMAAGTGALPDEATRRKMVAFLADL